MDPKRPNTNLEKKIEEENDEKIDALYSRIEEIKSAALDIQEETKSSTSLGEQIYGGVLQSADGIAGTIARFDEVLANKNNKVMIYVIGACVICFLLLWKGVAFGSQLS